MSDEKAIHNAVDAAKRKGQDRWDYEGIVFFFLSGRHFSQFSFTGCGHTLYRHSIPLLHGNIKKRAPSITGVPVSIRIILDL